MIKYVYCIRKRADMTDEEFHTYWRERHGAFIRSLAKVLRAKKYIQSHTMNTPINEELVRSRGLDTPPYDGVTEIWWDSMEDFLASVNSPEGIESLLKSTSLMRQILLIFRNPAPFSPKNTSSLISPLSLRLNLLKFQIQLFTNQRRLSCNFC